jgi:hypothetical protein
VTYSVDYKTHTLAELLQLIYLAEYINTALEGACCTTCREVQQWKLDRARFPNGHYMRV